MRASALLSLCLCAALSLGPVSPAAVVLAGEGPGAEAPQLGITEAVLSTGQGTGVLLDGNRSSTLALEGSATITLRAEQPIAHLYLTWDTPPTPWTLQAAGGATTCGQQGYLHEAVSLDTPASELVLTLGQGDYILCDIAAYGPGALPAQVQQWQPPLERADLLALPTHADDEHLFFGGILPTYAGEQGLAVQVAYMTNHWGERYRPHELLDGLWTVGVTAYPVMGPFPDLYASLASLESAESVFDRGEVLAFQVELLRRFKPRVVVGHDLAGEYGHGAHILNAQTLVEALALSGDEASHPDTALEYGAWEVQKAYLHLYAENELVMDWNQPLARFGGATAFEMAVAGFAKHLSQQDYFQVQQSGTWKDCRRFGLIHTTVGPDVVGGDLFENIDLSPEPVPEPEPVSEEPPPASSAVASSTEEDAASAPPVADGSLPMLVWLLVGAAALVALLVAALVLLHRSPRARKGKK